MATVWRRTPSAFLILALNIIRILSQNVEPNCPLPPQAFQGEPLRDYNPGLVNPQLQMNNLFLYPPNGLVPGGPAAPILECQGSSFQDRLCTQGPLNQQVNVPISQSPCASLSPINTAMQSSSCVDASGQIFNIPGQLLPYPQSILPQNQYPIGTQASPCLPPQNSGSPVLEMIPPPQSQLGPLAQGTCLVGSPPTSLPASNSGVDIWPCQPQCPSSYQQVDSSPFYNSVSTLSNHFTPLVPTVNPGISVPCLELLYPQGIPLSSSICPNPGASVDVFPIGPAQCLSAISPASQINNFPQDPVFGPQCDILQQVQPSSADMKCPSSIGSTFRNYLPFSPFMFQRPTIFPSMSPTQCPLDNTLASPCDLTSANSPINTPNQGTVCANPTLIEQDPLFPQAPLASASSVPNVPVGLPNQNVQLFSLQSSSISQPPLNPGPCSLTTDLASIFCLPPPLIPQAYIPWGFGNVLPQVANLVDFLSTMPPCLKNTLPSMLPTNGPSIYDSSNLCQSAVTNTVPIPINLQISIPPPIVPAPSITIINTTPASDTAVPTATQEANFFDLPMPPMIIEGRRSRSRSWLPLILVALFARDGDGGYGGGCSCDSGPIPIPYPIPIPTNNPVIVNK